VRNLPQLSATLLLSNHLTPLIRGKMFGRYWPLSVTSVRMHCGGYLVVVEM